MLAVDYLNENPFSIRSKNTHQPDIAQLWITNQTDNLFLDIPLQVKLAYLLLNLVEENFYWSKVTTKFSVKYTSLTCWRKMTGGTELKEALRANWWHYEGGRSYKRSQQALPWRKSFCHSHDPHPNLSLSPQLHPGTVNWQFGIPSAVSCAAFGHWSWEMLPMLSQPQSCPQPALQTVALSVTLREKHPSFPADMLSLPQSQWAR